MLKKFIIAIIKLTASLIMLAGTLTFGLAIIILLRSSGEITNSRSLMLFSAGFGGGFIAFTTLFHFTGLYVFGHELTHFLAAKLFRRRTGKFTVRGSSGSVAVERPNIWISLAPYFIPIYTLLWIGLYGLWQFSLPTSPKFVWLVFNTGVGVTYSYHVCLTIKALKREQNDLQRYGRLFSISVILLANMLLLFGGTTIAFSAWQQSAYALSYSIQKEYTVVRDIVTLTANRLWLSR